LVGAAQEGGGFQETKFVVDGLSPTEVFVEILACGFVSSNHFLRGDREEVLVFLTKQKRSTECATPTSSCCTAGAIPGHEMVGVVQAVGSDVKNVKVGQRVGAGWQYSSCHKCEWCEEGEEILCKDKVNYMQRKGGFSEAVVWESHFVIPVPDNIPNEVY